MDKIIEMKVWRKDSERYWETNCFFEAPLTLRSPISFALKDHFAVDIFMKLMQAMITTKMAMIEKIYTYTMAVGPCL